MATKIYGASDDLVEVDGDVRGEVGHFGSGDDDDNEGGLMICSDGTMLTIRYGKLDMGIWGITLVKQGELFDRIDTCTDEDANPHSDVAHFKDGLTFAHYAREWQRVR